MFHTDYIRTNSVRFLLSCIVVFITLMHTWTNKNIANERLVALDQKYVGKASIIHVNVPLKHSSLCVALCFASITRHASWSHIYAPNDVSVQRSVYNVLLKQLRLDAIHLWKVFKSLYVVCSLVNYWYKSFSMPPTCTWKEIWYKGKCFTNLKFPGITLEQKNSYIYLAG